MGNAESKLNKIHPEPDTQEVVNVMPIEIYGANYAEDDAPAENNDAALPNDANVAEVAPTTPVANPPGDENEFVDAVLEDALSRLLNVPRFIAWSTARDVRRAAAADLSKRHGLEEVSKSNTRGGLPEATRVYNLHELYEDDERTSEEEADAEAEVAEAEAKDNSE